MIGAPKKHFDVVRPGATAASATTRPLIVGHGTTLRQDPMVAGSAAASTPRLADKLPEARPVAIELPPDQAKPKRSSRRLWVGLIFLLLALNAVVYYYVCDSGR